MENNINNKQIEDISATYYVDKPDDVRQMPKNIVIKLDEGMVESHFIELPFINYYKTKDPVYGLTYYWYSDGKKFEVEVKSSTNGIPTAFEFDILLALNRLYGKRNRKFIQNPETNMYDNIEGKIKFTYRQLAKEMGYKSFGGTIYERIHTGIETLLETTIYTQLVNLVVKNNFDIYMSKEEKKELEKIQENENIDEDEKQKKKSNIINNTLQKRVGFHILEMVDNETIVDKNNTFRNEVVVKINEYFFESLKKGYFAKYNENMLKLLKSDVAKKVFLILNKWAKNADYRIYKLQTLYERIPLPNTKNNKYRKKRLKDAMEELVNVNFIQKYEFIKNKDNEDCVKIYFKQQDFINSYCAKDKFNSILEVTNGLKEFGLEDNEIHEKCTFDQYEYIQKLLRLCYIKCQYNQIKDTRKFLLKGLSPNPQYVIDDKFSSVGQSQSSKNDIKEKDIEETEVKDKQDIDKDSEYLTLFLIIKEKLKSKIPEVSYNTWIKDLYYKTTENNICVIGCLQQFISEIVNKQYLQIIKDVANELGIEDIVITYFENDNIGSSDDTEQMRLF